MGLQGGGRLGIGCLNRHRLSALLCKCPTLWTSKFCRGAKPGETMLIFCVDGWRKPAHVRTLTMCRCFLKSWFMYCKLKYCPSIFVGNAVGRRLPQHSLKGRIIAWFTRATKRKRYEGMDGRLFWASISREPWASAFFTVCLILTQKLTEKAEVSVLSFMWCLYP